MYLSEALDFIYIGHHVHGKGTEWHFATDNQLQFQSSALLLSAAILWTNGHRGKITNFHPDEWANNTIICLQLVYVAMQLSNSEHILFHYLGNRSSN
jgi:hypothetical protein